MKTTYRTAKSILSKASGYISSFDYTLNPYAGCAFGCTYCYAAFFAPTDSHMQDWGRWVEIKENALDLLKKRRKRPLIDKTIYISSVTDPYQPVERKLELTRALLTELLEHHRAHIVIQTRSPLVTRDIDLLRQFERVRVNITVTTDDEVIRKVFEPTCVPNPQRIDAIREIASAGIPAAVTLTPLLPVRDAESFAHALKATGAQRFVVQYFQASQRRFAAGTGARAVELAALQDWNPARYQQVKAVLARMLPNLYEGRDGFAPES